MTVIDIEGDTGYVVSDKPTPHIFGKHSNWNDKQCTAVGI